VKRSQKLKKRHTGVKNRVFGLKKVIFWRKNGVKQTQKLKKKGKISL